MADGRKPCDFCLTCSRPACNKRIPAPAPAPVPAPAPTPAPVPNIKIPTVNDPDVTGIKPDETCRYIAVGETLNLYDVKEVFVSNPWSFNVIGTFVKCINEGSTCCKIVKNDGTVRLFGLYTSHLPSSRLLLGSVSEHDPANAMRWWSEFSCKDLSDDTKVLTGKCCDLHYIYLNGGPGEYGWRLNYTSKEYNLEPEGKRAINFLRNTQRLGGFTCFVYYNIPAGGESYWTNKQNYENALYMKDYFYDLNYLLDLINAISAQQTVYIIVEPDMLSYILQNEPPSADGIVHPDNVRMDLSLVKELGISELKDLSLANTLKGWVTAVNTLISKKCPQVRLMHKVNLWGSLSGRNWEKGLDKGLIPSTTIIGQEAGIDLINRNADIISQFYREANVTLNTTYICADRYGLDGALLSTTDAKEPQNSRWFWNNDIWKNYIHFCNRVATSLKCKLYLWQLPCGYINSCQEISPYTGKPFADLPNISPSGEDGAPCFIFGTKFTRTTPETLKYFSSDMWKDQVVVNGNTITWKDHTDDLAQIGVEGIMFGAGVGASTSNLYMGQTAGKATDNAYCISKFQQFYSK